MEAPITGLNSAAAREAAASVVFIPARLGILTMSPA
jgi:hypothetical protein